MPNITLPDRPEVVAYNPLRERANLRQELRDAKATFIGEKNIPLVGGQAEEIHFRMAEGAVRWAYVFHHRLDDDAFAEESLVCTARISDHAAIADAMLAARGLE